MREVLPAGLEVQRYGRQGCPPLPGGTTFQVVSGAVCAYTGGVKTKTFITRAKTLWFTLGFLGALLGTQAEDPTAFELAKEGNRYIGEQSKDKVVQIRSEKSVASLTPKIWRVVYRDETATLKTVEVKFVAGKMTDVKRPLRLLEPITDKNGPLDHKKLKIDSDKAIKTALKEPILENLKITATELKLEHGDEAPVWKIRLWASKLKNPNKDVDLGEITLSAEDGKIVKLDVHLSRVE